MAVSFDAGIGTSLAAINVALTAAPFGKRGDHRVVGAENHRGVDISGDFIFGVSAPEQLELLEKEKIPFEVVG